MTNRNNTEYQPLEDHGQIRQTLWGQTGVGVGRILSNKEKKRKLIDMDNRVVIKGGG